MNHFELTTIDEFAKQYLQLREKEGRICTDEEVAKLPDVLQSHPLYNEWRLRKKSCRELLKYIREQDDPSILEVGCGNGWLTAHLAAVTKGKVVGIDVNAFEIDQARRVFSSKLNLSFERRDLQSFKEEGRLFDSVVFAASIQYFANFKQVVDLALSCLNERGDVHIIDSHFYSDMELRLAKQRSADYFKRMGSAGLSAFYFHHVQEDLNGYDYEIMNQRRGLIQWLKPRAVFPWIRISNIKSLG